MSIWVKNSKILLTPQWGREPTFTPPHSFTPLKKKQLSHGMVQWINAGGTETKNIKNSLLAMPVLRTQTHLLPPLKNDKAVCALARRGHLFASKWVIFEKNGGDVKKWAIRVIL